MLDTFLEHFKKAANNIGISYDEQERRGLCFHSWRHYYNASLRGEVKDEVLQKFVGHKSKDMTDNYDHITEDNLGEIYQALEAKILPFVKKAG